VAARVRTFHVMEGHDLHLFPGFTDVHVHLREPGFSYKETIASGTRAAARGGFTTVCAMPNLNPVPDSAEHLQQQLDMIKQTSVIRVLPYGAITVGEKGQVLSDMEAMAPHVAGFSDDGKGVQRRDMMVQAMERACSLNKIIAAHCEDETLLNGGWIHDGAWAQAHGHTGIPSESEWRQVERDLALAAQTGCKYHVCHVSTKESVALIRDAKARGVDVTCETAPHYLLMNDSMLNDHGRFKMNPPIRAKRRPGRADRGPVGRHHRHDCHRPCAAQRPGKSGRPAAQPERRGGAGNGLCHAVHRAGQAGHIAHGPAVKTP
jgi:dihydroorotase